MVIQVIMFVCVELFWLCLFLRLPGSDIFRIRDEYLCLISVELFFSVLLIIELLVFRDESNATSEAVSRLVYHFFYVSTIVIIVCIHTLYPRHVDRAIWTDIRRIETTFFEISYTRSCQFCRTFFTKHFQLSRCDNKLSKITVVARQVQSAQRCIVQEQSTPRPFTYFTATMSSRIGFKAFLK